MDGSLYNEPARHLELFGKWYKSRRELFTEAIPMNYKGKNPPGVSIKDNNFKCICTIHKNDYLLHLIPLRSVPKKSLTINLSIKKWKKLKKIILEPIKKEISFIINDKYISISIPKDDVERIDTILRIKDS